MMPSNMQHLTNRRQHEYHYPYPPQAHTYAGYQHPLYPPMPHAPQYAPQHWYQPYPSPQPYSTAPRQYHPPAPPPQHQQPIPQHHGPVIVSSHPPPPQPAPTFPVRPTPAVSTPPAPQTQTPQPASSTPSVASQRQPSPATPTTSISTSTPPPSAGYRPTLSAASPGTLSGKRMPFYPPLPWYSSPGEAFPPKAPRRRKRIRDMTPPDTALELPTRDEEKPAHDVPEEHAKDESDPGNIDQLSETQSSTVAALSDQETPATSQPPSEAGTTRPKTPPPPSESVSTVKAQPSQHAPRPATRPALPIPVTPKTIPKPKAQQPSAAQAETTSNIPAATPQVKTPEGAQEELSLPQDTGENLAVPTSAPAKLAPKSWADLVRTRPSPLPLDVPQTINGETTPTASGLSKVGTLAEAIRSYTVDSASKISFLEPRGLVNNGNMCYMNSILQVLVFCIPFYDFLDLVGKKATHSFKSDTPLLDAMIMFIREFKVIDAAESSKMLRMRLKDHELEQYGDPFSPDYVYNVIRQLPRFSAMKRGHQQDAEEFLGLLLSAIHDECARLLQTLSGSSSDKPEVTSPLSDRSGSVDGGWLEVGPKQKASITRSSGFAAADAPTTKIFGGKLRSELRVPGLKSSVTLEPYQPLQLAISSPEVNNLIDALKGLTKPETLHGDFNSPRGPGTTATKQLFIESLPPVLIIHLKRFQYDSAGGAQKIWKKVGYPLDLTIPKEVFPQHKRGQMALGGLPKYRLTSVVYHHGKNINSGHYTVDVLRQDGQEWIRLDDTIIRRIRSEDVARDGAEEDPKVLAKALEAHKKDSAAGKNIFEQFESEETQSEQGEWNQVNTASKDGSAKKTPAVANGEHTPSTAGKRTPKHESLKDKVAYLLVYRRVD